jgi:hypothetical protein
MSAKRVLLASLVSCTFHLHKACDFRQFLLRGLKKVRQERAIVCLAHNILKLAGGMKAAVA